MRLFFLSIAFVAICCGCLLRKTQIRKRQSQLAHRSNADLHLSLFLFAGTDTGTGQMPCKLFKTTPNLKEELLVSICNSQRHKGITQPWRCAMNHNPRNIPSNYKYLPGYLRWRQTFCSEKNLLLCHCHGQFVTVTVAQQLYQRLLHPDITC